MAINPNILAVGNGSIEIVEGAITRLGAGPKSAIVNAARRDLTAGGGVCGAIFGIADTGGQLTADCNRYGGIQNGQAIITDSYGLQNGSKSLGIPGIGKIIHAVGPDWNEGGDETQNRAALAAAYRNSLELAYADPSGIDTITFPTLSGGIFGCNSKVAVEIAINEARKFLERHKNDVPARPLKIQFTTLPKGHAEYKPVDGTLHSNYIQELKNIRDAPKKGGVSTYSPSSMTGVTPSSIQYVAPLAKPKQAPAPIKLPTKPAPKTPASAAPSIPTVDSRSLAERAAVAKREIDEKRTQTPPRPGDATMSPAADRAKTASQKTPVRKLAPETPGLEPTPGPAKPQVKIEITQQDFAKLAQENRTQYSNIEIAVPASSDPTSAIKAFEIKVKSKVDKEGKTLQSDTIANVNFVPSAANSQTGSIVALLSEPNPKYVDVVFKQIQGVKGTAEIFGCDSAGTEAVAAQMFVNALLNGNKVKFEDSTKEYLQSLPAPKTFDSLVNAAIGSLSSEQQKEFGDKFKNWPDILSDSFKTTARHNL